MLSFIKTVLFVLVLSYGAEARAYQVQPNDPNNPDYPYQSDYPHQPDYPDHPDYPHQPDYPDYPHQPDYPNYPDYPNNPSCTYPKNKPKPVNCYFALKKYQVKNGIIVSPGSENQKSCYECQVKLSSTFGGDVTKIKYEDAENAVRAILKCPSGYGSIQVKGGDHDERTSLATVAIEVGSGKCEDLF